MKSSWSLSATIVQHSLAVAVAVALMGGTILTGRAQDKPAPADRAARPVIRVPTALTLEVARVIVEARKPCSKLKTAALLSP